MTGAAAVLVSLLAGIITGRLLASRWVRFDDEVDHRIERHRDALGPRSIP